MPQLLNDKAFCGISVPELITDKNAFSHSNGKQEKQIDNASSSVASTGDNDGKNQFAIVKKRLKTFLQAKKRNLSKISKIFFLMMFLYFILTCFYSFYFRAQSSYVFTSVIPEAVYIQNKIWPGLYALGGYTNIMNFLNQSSSAVVANDFLMASNFAQNDTITTLTIQGVSFFLTRVMKFIGDSCPKYQEAALSRATHSLPDGSTMIISFNNYMRSFMSSFSGLLDRNTWEDIELFRDTLSGDKKTLISVLTSFELAIDLDLENGYTFYWNFQRIILITMWANQYCDGELRIIVGLVLRGETVKRLQQGILLVRKDSRGTT